VIDHRGRLLLAALGFAGLPMLSYDRALWALRSWLDSWPGIGATATGAPGLRSPAHALRREGLAGHLQHDRDGALDHERHGLSVGTHAVACRPEWKEHRGYTIVAQSREDPLGSGEWFPRWTATRLDKPSADSKSGTVAQICRTESEADDAALRDGCSWIDSFGKGNSDTTARLAA